MEEFLENAEYQDAPRVTKGQRTAERIFEAAIRCIANLGIDKTSVTTIAQEAGASRGLVAFYIPKQDELFRQVIERIAYRSAGAISVAPSQTTPEERIIHHVCENFRHWYENPDEFKCVLLLRYYAAFKPELRVLNSRLTRQSVEVFESELRLHFKNPSPHLNLRTLAESLHAEMLAMIERFYTVHPQTADQELDAQEYFNRCVEWFLRRLRQFD